MAFISSLIYIITKRLLSYLVNYFILYILYFYFMGILSLASDFDEEGNRLPTGLPARVLAFMLYDKRGAVYINTVGLNFFKGADDMLIFTFLKELYKINGDIQPTPGSVFAYIQDQLTNVYAYDEETYEMIAARYHIICESYNPLNADIVLNVLIPYAQQNLLFNTVKLMVDAIDAWDNDQTSGVLLSAEKELEIRHSFNKALNIKSVLTYDSSKTFVFGDAASVMMMDRRASRVYKTKFSKLNSLFNNKGLSAGEITVFMSGAKAGKTTLLINLAIDFLKQGVNVLYVDTENGLSRINKLLYQNIGCLESSRCKDREITRYVRQLSDETLMFGGKLMVYAANAHKATTADVHQIMSSSYDEEKYLPEVIIVDYFDNMASVDGLSGFKDKRQQLRSVYMEWKAFAQDTSTTVITVSQVTRSSMEKPIFTSADIAEDIGKVQNADYIIGYQKICKIAKFKSIVDKSQPASDGTKVRKFAFTDSNNSDEDDPSNKSPYWVGLISPVAMRDARSDGMIEIIIDYSTTTIVELGDDYRDILRATPLESIDSVTRQYITNNSNVVISFEDLELSYAKIEQEIDYAELEFATELDVDTLRSNIRERYKAEAATLNITESDLL